MLKLLATTENIRKKYQNNQLQSRESSRTSSGKLLFAFAISRYKIITEDRVIASGEESESVLDQSEI